MSAVAELPDDRRTAADLMPRATLTIVVVASFAILCHLAVVLWLIGGWPLFIWGFCLSTVLLWHDTFTIISLSHLFGSRRYETSDTSKNNWLLALLTLGEGWHNNHHHFMASARQGFFWWEIDITYYTLKMLSWFGIVWDLRKVPVHLLTQDRLAA